MAVTTLTPVKGEHLRSKLFTRHIENKQKLKTDYDPFTA
jgi:hypothetical protein